MALVIGALVAVVAVLVVLWVVSVYNALVRSRNGLRNAFTQLDVQLRRRLDLVADLLDTAPRDCGLLEARDAAVTGLSAASTAPGEPHAMAQFATTQAGLVSALGRLGSAHSAELEENDTAVSVGRQAYNEATRRYNVRRESRPTNLLAGLFGFGPAAPW